MLRNIPINLHIVSDEYSTVFKLKGGEWIVLLDTSNNTVNYTLPTPVSGTSLIIGCVNAANDAYIKSTETAKINGESAASIELTYRGDFLKLIVSDGQWQIVNPPMVISSDTVRDAHVFPGGGEPVESPITFAFVDTGSTVAAYSGSAELLVSDSVAYLLSSGGIQTAPTDDLETWTLNAESMPQNTRWGATYTDGTYNYAFGGTGGYQSIQRALVSDPLNYIVQAETLPLNVNTKAKYTEGTKLYLFSGASIISAQLSDLLSWSVESTTAYADLSSCSIIEIGDYFYAYGDYGKGIYRTLVSAPTSWEKLTAEFPINIGGGLFIKIGEYIYSIGGDTYEGAIYGPSDAIYVAHIDSPISFTLKDEAMSLGYAYFKSALSADETELYIFDGTYGTNYDTSEKIYKSPIT